MKIVKTISEVRAAVKAWRAEGLSVGLVPTMGFLHEGHKSLIDRAVKENDRVVVSDFVNPTQFGPTEDLASYPRDLERDATLCENAGAALLFNPEPSEMYAEDACTFVDMSGLTGELCGKSRPIHFRGVCTVVSKLFHIVAPDRAYFGQKDAQQLSVIRRMVRDLNFDIEIIGCPIVREADGLAKSSRNTYLNAEERKAALVLSQAVKLGQKLAADGEASADAITTAMKELIEKEPLARIDYVKAVDAVSVEPVSKMQPPVLVAMAVLDYVGSITVDSDLLAAAGILEYEKVQIVDINNGERFETYTIAGEAGSGMICLNGAAARCVQKGDKIILMCYCQMTPEEAAVNPPKVVFVDEENKISRVSRYEKHGRLEDM